MLKRPVQDKFIHCWLHVSLVLGFAGLASAIVLLFQEVYSAEWLNKKLLIFVFCLLLLILNCLILSCILYLFSEKRRKNEADFVQNAGACYFEYYQMALENESKISVMYHEVANQMQIINELFDEGNKTQAGKIADELRGQFDSVRSVRFCGNRIINVILSLKQKEASVQGCRLEAQISSLPAEFIISDLDLSMLLTNLIDNAVAGTSAVGATDYGLRVRDNRVQDKNGQEHYVEGESVEKQKKSVDEDRTIFLKIGYRSGCLIISLSNPTVMPDGDYSKERLKTTKKVKQNHGIGLTLIREIVKKYDGNLSVRVQNGSFMVRIVIEV